MFCVFYVHRPMLFLLVDIFVGVFFFVSECRDGKKVGASEVSVDVQNEKDYREGEQRKKGRDREREEGRKKQGEDKEESAEGRERERERVMTPCCCLCNMTMANFSSETNK